MSDANVNEAYCHDRLVDGLKLASDSAVGLGNGNRNTSEVVLHSKFIQGLRQAENAARMIAHSRGDRGGYAWLKLASKLGTMLEASSKAVGLSALNSAVGFKNNPRGVLWVMLGEGLKVIASDCLHATQQKTDKALVLGGMEYVN